MIATALQVIAALVLAVWALVGAYLLRMAWQDAREQQAVRAKHADVDALAQRTKAMSARSARVEAWHDLPTADELGI